MKELFMGIAAQMASKEISEEQAIVRMASSAFDEKLWRELIENLPSYQNQPEMASCMTSLLCAWAYQKLDEAHQKEGMLWKGWGSLLISEFAAANACFSGVKNYYREREPDRLCHSYLLYADAYGTIGRFSKAVEHYEEALKFAPEEPLKKAEVLCKIAQAQKCLGKPEDALSFYEKALVTLGANDKSAVAAIAGAMCDIIQGLEQPDAGRLEKLEKLASLAEKNGADMAHAIILSEMARLIVLQGYKERAIECLEQAKGLTGDRSSRERSDILSQLGKLYQEEGKFIEAIQCFEQSRKILRELEEADRRQPVPTKTPSATAATGKKPGEEISLPAERVEEPQAGERKDEGAKRAADGEQKILAYKQQLREARQEQDADRECLLLHELGNVHFSLGNPEAMQCWHESLALAQQQQNMEVLYQNYLRLGLLFLQNRDLESARTALMHGIEILEVMRDYVASISVGFIEEHVDIFHQIINCCVRMGNMASALHFLEHMHRWMFLGRVHDRLLLSRSSIAEEIQKEYAQALERLQIIYRNVQDRPSRKAWESSVRATWRTIHQYQEKLEELRTQFEVFDPEWERLFGKRFRFDPAELQRNLPQGTVVLEFLPTGDETLIFVVDARQIDAIFIKDLGEKVIGQLLQPFEELENFRRLWQDWCIERRLGTSETQNELKAQLDASPYKNIYDAQRAWKAALDQTNRKLSEIILPRLLPVLEGLQADRLVLIPCHAIALFPLHLLVLPNTEHVYLQDNYEIVYAPSATLFLESCNRQPQKNKQLLLIGYPGPNLRFFHEELNRIPHVWPGETSAQFQEKTKPELICEKMPAASHIHLGVHSLSTFPDPLDSLLHLADEDQSNVFHLRIPHIMAKFRLSAEVVTLAANDREFRYNRVGRAMGPVEALLYTGAKAVVGTLWPVPDLAMFLLMETFYHGLSQGLPPAMAVYEAQNELRNMTVESLLNRLSLHLKLLPEAKRSWLKQVCAVIGRESVSGESKKSAMEILYAFRDAVTADVSQSGMEISDFLLEGLDKSPVGDIADPKFRPFEHPLYWGSLTCNGMGLTQVLDKPQEVSAHSVSVYIEDLGFLQDEQGAARDIEDALAALTDEGLKTCESVAKVARENPVIQENLATAKRDRQYFKARCPNCGKKIRCLMVSEGGGTAKCPQCERKIRIPPRPSPFDDIKILAVCPHCAGDIHCFLPMAGRRAKCGLCQKKVRIPKREILLAEIASKDITSRIVLLDQ